MRLNQNTKRKMKLELHRNTALLDVLTLWLFYSCVVCPLNNILACQRYMKYWKIKFKWDKFKTKNSASATHLELSRSSHDPASHPFLMPVVNNESAGRYGIHTAHVQKCDGANVKPKTIHHKGRDSSKFMFTSFTGSVGRDWSNGALRLTGWKKNPFHLKVLCQRSKQGTTCKRTYFWPPVEHSRQPYTVSRRWFPIPQRAQGPLGMLCLRRLTRVWELSLR